MLCRMAKRAYRLCERNILAAATSTAKDVMNAAVLVVKSITKCSNTSIGECGISVDDRIHGHSSLKVFYRNFIHRHWKLPD
ncbi:hypothetical protein TNCT_339421 [Trichonephila clavata]|uniref:Uncharacterized protein n=1 Tax=Trichonephila clavata TaxID=2740835 RepID=A0A8X6LXM2_TRICU|nr:hypothetical protein TNCT_339421 [Trichonephila clavata]